MASLLLESGPSLAGASGPDLTRYFLVCGLLLVLVGGLAFGARRLLSGHLRRRAKQRSLQVVDVLPLGGKQKLCVVRCYDRTFLLGVGDREVRSIAELDTDPAALEGALQLDTGELAASAEATHLSFDEQLVDELRAAPPLAGADAANRRAGDAPDAVKWNQGEGVLG